MNEELMKLLDETRKAMTVMYNIGYDDGYHDKTNEVEGM